MVRDRSNLFGNHTGDLFEGRVGERRLGVEHLLCPGCSHRRRGDRSESDPEAVAPSHDETTDGGDHHRISNTDLCKLLRDGHALWNLSLINISEPTRPY